jgi:hypothetical protein
VRSAPRSEEEGDVSGTDIAAQVEIGLAAEVGAGSPDEAHDTDRVSGGGARFWRFRREALKKVGERP